MDLVQEAQAVVASEDSRKKYGQYESPIRLPVIIIVNKNGATVTSDPDFWPALEECEFQVDW